MEVRFTTSADNTSTATYTTAWHERSGQRRYRVVEVTRRLVYTPLLRRDVVEYRITHTEHTDGGAAYRMLDAGVSTFAAAIDALGRELERLIVDGFAHKSDLERVPRVPVTARHEADAAR